MIILYVYNSFVKSVKTCEDWGKESFFAYIVLNGYSCVVSHSHAVYPKITPTSGILFDILYRTVHHTVTIRQLWTDLEVR